MAQAMYSKLSSAQTQTPRSIVSVARVLRSPLRPAIRPSRLTVQAQIPSDGEVSRDAALSRRQAIAAGAVGSLVSGSILANGVATPRPALAEEAASPPQEADVQAPAALAPAEQSVVSSPAMDLVEIGRSGAWTLDPKPCGPGRRRAGVQSGRQANAPRRPGQGVGSTEGDWRGSTCAMHSSCITPACDLSPAELHRRKRLAIGCV